MLSFYVGAGGPHTCVLSTSLTEPSCLWLLKICLDRKRQPGAATVLGTTVFDFFVEHHVPAPQTDCVPRRGLTDRGTLAGATLCSQVPVHPSDCSDTCWWHRDRWQRPRSWSQVAQLHSAAERSFTKVRGLVSQDLKKHYCES